MEYGYVGPAFVENQNGAYVRVEIVDWFKTVYGAPVALTAHDAAHHLASLHDYSEYLNCLAVIADVKNAAIAGNNCEAYRNLCLTRHPSPLVSVEFDTERVTCGNGCIWDRV